MSVSVTRPFKSATLNKWSKCGQLTNRHWNRRRRDRHSSCMCSMRRRGDLLMRWIRPLSWRKKRLLHSIRLTSIRGRSSGRGMWRVSRKSMKNKMMYSRSSCSRKCRWTYLQMKYKSLRGTLTSWFRRFQLSKRHSWIREKTHCCKGRRICRKRKSNSKTEDSCLNRERNECSKTSTSWIPASTRRSWLLSEKGLTYLLI